MPSQTQFEKAREKGTEILMARARLRHEVMNGEADLPAILEQEKLPEWLEKGRLKRTLRYQPRVGESAADALIASLPPLYKPDSYLSSIPHPRRIELAQALRERA